MIPMIDIKEGFELDRKIADAIDWTLFILVYVNPMCSARSEALCSSFLIPEETKGTKDVIEIGPYHPSITEDNIPKYSIDTNEAINAAQRLSDHLVLVRDEVSDGLWECKLIPSNDPENWGRAETPALAICSAILKFKEINDG